MTVLCITEAGEIATDGISSAQCRHRTSTSRFTGTSVLQRIALEEIMTKYIALRKSTYVTLSLQTCLLFTNESSHPKLHDFGLD
jgi:hypothetical protein